MVVSANHSKQMKISILHYSNSIIDLEKVFGMQRMELSELRELKKKGVDAYLYAKEVVGDHPQIAVVPYRENDRALLDIPYYTRFFDLARDSDILQGNATPLLAVFRPEKTILRFDGFVDLVLAETEDVRQCYQKANHIFVSAYLKNRYRTTYDWLPDENCHVLHNAVDHGEPERYKQNSKTKMLFCSRWVSDKGIYVLLDALKRLEKHSRHFDVYIAGGIHSIRKSHASSEYESKIERQFMALSNVHILGYLEHGALLKLMQEVDILLFPSIWGEPFGLVPAEAAMLSVPTIAFATGALPEVVLDRETGILVKKSRYHRKNVKRYSAAIEHLLANPSLVRTYGENARQHCIENFTWEKYMDKLMRVYDCLMK